MTQIENSDLYMAFGIVHSVLFLLLVVNGALAIVSDPTDPAIYYSRFYENNPFPPLNLDILYIQGHLTICDACDLAIMTQTHHCKTCNRCCYKFDHHCIWLNNCIGQSNYYLFIRSILFLALYIISSNAIIHQIIHDIENQDKKV